jgi:MFS family permease
MPTFAVLMPTTSSRPYGLGFWLMCLSSFLFFLSFNLLLPELPDHLTRLGGGEYKGFIIALFTLTAGLSRPFSGKLSDTVGRIPVMIFGSLVCFLCGFAYPIAGTVAAFMGLRLLHGFSTGFKPTGTAAYIADIVPAERRGEAMGLVGLTGTLGMAVGPMLGTFIGEHFTINTLFYISSGVALLSVLVQGSLTETLPAAQRQKFRLGLLRLRRDELIEPRVLVPALVMLLTLFPFGAVLTVIPDQSKLLGVTTMLGLPIKGVFYTAYTLAALAIRLAAGRASDRYGRVRVLRWSVVVVALSLATLATWTTPVGFLVAAVLFGLGTGLVSPTLLAWGVDLSDPANRGRAMATLYIALEAGIGMGALAAGWIYANHAPRLPWVHGLSLLMTLAALAYLFTLPMLPAPAPAAEPVPLAAEDLV